MKKFKVGILTIICALAMVMPVMAASSVSQYYGPIGTYIQGQLKTSSETCGGLTVAKSFNIITKTGMEVDKIVVKYEVQNKNGQLADVYNSYGEYEVSDASSYEKKWSTSVSGNGDSYTVFGTHEMRDNVYSYAFYTSTDL